MIYYISGIRISQDGRPFLGLFLPVVNPPPLPACNQPQSSSSSLKILTHEVGNLLKDLGKAAL